MRFIEISVEKLKVTWLKKAKKKRITSMLQ